MSVATKAPRKWLGPKGGWLIFAGITFVWLFNLLFNVLVVGHPGYSPNSIILGGLGMTGAFLYTLAYRLQPSQGLTVGRLVIGFVVGGFLSTELAVVIEYLADLIPSPLELAVHALAGVIEEACKLFAVVVVSRGLTQRTARNGLFLGGAVGLGFAALEDMKYAVAAFTDPPYFHNGTGSAITITLLRDLIGPLEHPIFTALLAAALFAASRNGRFRITGLVIGVYLAVSLAHGIIDSTSILAVLAGVNVSASGLISLAVSVVIAVANGIVWLRVSRRLKLASMIALRPASADDLEFLIWTLVATANWDRNRGVTFDSVQRDPALWHYLEGWPRASDFGIIALDNAQPVGAIWARTLGTQDAGYGFVDDATPELTLGVVPVARRRGIGRMLLTAIIAEARSRELPGLSLSVEDGNVVARKLYTRAGFTVVGRTGNSDTMLLRF